MFTFHYDSLIYGRWIKMQIFILHFQTQFIRKRGDGWTTYRHDSWIKRLVFFAHVCQLIEALHLWSADFHLQILEWRCIQVSDNND